MVTGTAVRRFAAYEVSGEPRLLAHVLMDGQARLLLAPNESEAWLEKLLQRLNNYPSLDIEAVPPPDAPQFARVSRSVERGSPEFEEALRGLLRDSYDVELRPA